MFRLPVFLLGIGLALASHATGGQAGAEPLPPFYLEAADCTAAFEARVIERKAQPPSEARNKAILQDTEHGFVFIGVAYKQGLRNPQADELLKAAEKRWHALSKAEQALRLNACSSKAAQLMDDVSMLERFIVRNRASARVDRLLEREAEQATPHP